MSLLKAFLERNKCDACGRQHGVERVRFDGEYVGQFCKNCRLFGAHTESTALN